MTELCYPYTMTPFEQNYIYFFKSIGIKGKITKLVVFQHIRTHEYNVALVDYDRETQTADDNIVTDNGDMFVVLTTVMDIVADFLEKFPQSILFIEGKSKIRQRLYNRVVRNHFSEIAKTYIVGGVLETMQQEEFLLDNSHNYIAIVIKKNEFNYEL